MSRRPWDTDRPLDAALAGRAIAEQFPDLAGRSVQFLASGWDNDCYLVGDAWVFRFPRRAEVVSTVHKETALLPIVSDAIDLAVPNFERVGEPCAAFPYPFVGYRLLPGDVLDTTKTMAIDEDAVAAQLGTALSQLHMIPRGRLAAVDLPGECWAPADDLKELCELAELVRQSMPAGLLPQWEPYLSGDITPPDPPRDTVLIHGDLFVEHVLFDRGTGRATAMLDFADADFGDPVQDLVVFNYVLGEPLIRKLLANYAPTFDETAWSRLRFITHVRAAIWLAEAARGGEVMERNLRWITRYAARLRE